MRKARIALLAMAMTLTGGAAAQAESVTPAPSAATWSLQSTPNPTTVQDGLQSVSCVSAESCEAVGFAASAGGSSTPLAERWNGTSWQVQTTLAGGTQLNSVSCATASSCLAVGQDGPSSNPTTFAEKWDGHAWTVTRTAPAGGTKQGVLLGVSYVSASSCIGVGWAFSNAWGTVPMAQRWNGSTWAADAAVNSPSDQGSVLNAVSCLGNDVCQAVGTNNGDGVTTPFVEVRTAGASGGWAITTVPLPPNTQTSWLHGVSCSAASHCTAGGQYEDTKGGTGVLAEVWNGQRWAVQPAATKAAPASGQIEAVSCYAASRCGLAGRGNPPTDAPLALGRAGTTWTQQTTALPAGSLVADFTGESCLSKTFCAAVGVNSADGGSQLTLAEVWNGSTWSVVPTPSPGGTSASAGLAAVSRASASTCISTNAAVASANC